MTSRLPTSPGLVAAVTSKTHHGIRVVRAIASVGASA
jgi:hypothetical protein